MNRRQLLAAALLSPFDVGEDERLLVVDTVGSSLVSLDARTLQRTGKAGLEKRPRRVALSPDGRTAFVTIYGTGVPGNNPMPGRSIEVVDLATMKRTRRISLGLFGGPSGLVVAPDGLLWASCETEGSVLRIDPAARKGGKAVTAIPVVGKTTRRLALTPDGGKLYVASGSGPVLSVVDTAERRLAVEIRVGEGISALAVAPDGRRLFAADATRPVLWSIDVNEDRIARRRTLEEPASEVLATADGASLLLAHEASGTVEVLEVPSLRTRGTLNVGRSPAGLAASVDGATGFAASWAEGTVKAFGLDPVRLVRTATIGGGPDGLLVARRPAGGAL